MRSSSHKLDRAQSTARLRCPPHQTISLISRRPDGVLLTIGRSRFEVPEALFRPQLMGTNADLVGVHELAALVVNSVDPDLRVWLLKNVVICGGTTMIDGTPIR